MYCLFLDTAWGEGVFALFSDGLVVEEVHTDLQVARHPCVQWQHLLERNSLSLKDVSFLACGVGPGSYTGLRNAVATAKGVAFGVNIPIVAVSSLLLYAPCVDGEYRIVMDAGIGGVYSQLVRTSTFIEGPKLMNVNEFIGSLQGNDRLFSNSSEWLQQKGNAAVSVIASHTAVIAGLVYKEFMQNGTCQNKVANRDIDSSDCLGVYSSEDLPLVYLRKTQAEIEKREVK